MNIPSVINTPGGIARFSREVREALSALQRRGTGPTLARQSPEVHPFALFAWYDPAEEETYLQANYGAFTRHRYRYDTTFEATSQDLDVKSGSPVGSTIGLGGAGPRIELAANATYGVWIVMEVAASSGVGTGGTPFFIMGTEVPVLLADAGAPNKTDAASITSPYSNYHAWYIGQVVVNAAGYPQVTQHRKSDISWTGCAWFEPDPPDPE
jgi:hypothetical protein